MLDPEEAASEPILEINLFGTPEVRVCGAPLPPLHSRRGMWILAILALRTGRSIERTQLAGLLWPDSLDSTALHNLRQALGDLRRALGPAAYLLHAEAKSLLALNVSAAFVDALAFDVAVAEGTEPSLERAAALYRGPLLDGCDEPWALEAREARAEVHLSVLERLAGHRAAATDHEGAVRWLRSAIAADPYREENHRRLMTLLSERGEATAAMEVYRQLRLRLRSELNQEPDASTVSLFRALREKRREPHKPGLQPVNKSLASLMARGLPVARTRLIGRTEAIIEVRERILESRLVTLCGIGGIGKTRLAVSVASELDADYEHGAIFVGLASLSDASSVPDAVLRAAGGRPPEGSVPAIDVLAEYLAPRRLLLILDNCEHLAAACSSLCDTLLESSPNLRILATSRHALGVAGESVYRVAGLAIPRSGTLRRGSVAEPLEDAGFSAVELFFERAAAAGAPIDPTPNNLAAVIDICSLVEGIPLAIELAAARARSIAAHEIAVRLRQGYDILTQAAPHKESRHRTLDATFEWSWKLLTPLEQRLLAGLSVFAGGFSLRAIESLWEPQSGDDPSPIDLLGSLVDKSLVVFSPAGASTGTSSTAPGEARYVLLEPVRQLAAVRLSQSGPNEVNTWRKRHLAYFVALAEDAEPHLKGPDQQSWIERLETEHDNLRAALEWAEGNDGGTGTRLCGAMWRFWELRGYLAEGREWCERSLSAARAEQRTEDRAKVLNGDGAMAIRQGEYASARTSWEESLSLFREVGDRHGIAYLLNNLGNVAHDLGDFATAEASFRESISIHRETGDQWGLANSLGNLGNVAGALGDRDSARNCYEESLAISRAIGDRRGMAYSLNNLGLVVGAQGDDARAQIYHRESLAIFREIGDRRGIANTLHDLGTVARAQGDFPSARTCYEESLTIRREIGDLSGISESLNSLANVVSRQGDDASV